MTVGSPLGRYAAFGALFAAVAVLLAGLLVHAAGALGVPTHPDALLDSMVFGAFLFLIGQQGGIAVGRAEGQTEAAAKINGLAGKVDAIHRRMDDAGLPASPVPEEPH